MLRNKKSTDTGCENCWKPELAEETLRAHYTCFRKIAILFRTGALLAWIVFGA
jgi:hypothetical protein